MTASSAATLSLSNIVPPGTRKPGWYLGFNTSQAVNSLPGNAITVLMVGQMLASGSAAANAMQSLFSSDDAANYFGAGSVLHLMTLAAFTANPYVSMQAIGIADAAMSTAAAWSLVVAGVAGNTDAMELQIGATFIPFSFAVGDTAAMVAAHILAQVAEYPNLPVVATVADAIVTLTAKNKGSLGNSIPVALLQSSAVPAPVGLTFALSQTGTGLIDPLISPALTTAFASKVNIVISACNNATNLTALSTWLELVSGPIEERGALGVAFATSTLSSATTLALGLNEGRLTLGLLRSAPNLSYELAAMYGSVIASEGDPAMPLNTLPLTGALPNAQVNWLSRLEQESCLANGVTPFEVGPGGKVQIVRAVSTYTQTAAGIADISLLDITTIRSLDYVRLAIRTRVALRFPRSKLSTRMPDKVRSEILDVLHQLEAVEIVENVEANAAQLLVAVDATSPTQLDAIIPANVVPGLMVFAGQINLIL